MKWSVEAGFVSYYILQQMLMVSCPYFFGIYFYILKATYREYLQFFAQRLFCFFVWLWPKNIFGLCREQAGSLRDLMSPEVGLNSMIDGKFVIQLPTPSLGYPECILYCLPEFPRKTEFQLSTMGTSLIMYVSGFLHSPVSLLYSYPGFLTPQPK